MADRPILFSAPMVRALLAGTKTQTRRVPPNQPVPAKEASRLGSVGAGLLYSNDLIWPISPGRTIVSNKPHPPEAWIAKNVRINAGDRLYVRETWSGIHAFRDTPPAQRESVMTPDGPLLRDDVWFWADGNPDGGDYEKPRPGIHLPRWASRLTLTVTNVRVERLQGISDDDAEAEGCPECEDCGGYGWINSGPDGGWQCMARGCGDAYRDQYARLWDQINGDGAWASNPWVAAYRFTVERGNIDQLAAAK